MKKRQVKKVTREPVLLRLKPELAEWYTIAASRLGRSRTKLMEECLQVICVEAGVLEHAVSEVMDPGTVIDVLATNLARQVIDLGFATPAISEWQTRRDAERDRELAEIRAARAGRGKTR